MSATPTRIKTIGVSEGNYFLIKQQGLAGDSMNDAMTNILHKAGLIQEPKNTSKKSQAGDLEGRQPATAAPTSEGGNG